MSWLGLLILAAAGLIGVATIVTAIVVPAIVLWNRTGKKTAPAIWVILVCSALALTSVQAYLRFGNVPSPTPVDEVIENVTDVSGEFAVTAIRLPNPQNQRTVFEIDVRNDGASTRYLGLQYSADGGTLGAYSPGQTQGAQAVAVQPNWSGTVEFSASLPGFTYGGHVVVVLALLKDPSLTDPLFLPDDSEALYQHRFVLIPEE